MVGAALAAVAGYWWHGGYRIGELIVGSVERVGDGDGFEIKGEAMRVWGVDAPEYDQVCKDRAGRPYRCGQVAQRALQALVLGKALRCVVRDVDSYRRPDVSCTLPNGQDLGRKLIDLGAAVELPQYSRGLYSSDEERARSKGAGIWQGEFDRPEVWKRAKRQGLALQQVRGS